jgi:hypothetical protein
MAYGEEILEESFVKGFFGVAVGTAFWSSERVDILGRAFAGEVTVGPG